MKYGKWKKRVNIGQGWSGRTHICQEKENSHEYFLQLLNRKSIWHN